MGKNVSLSQKELMIYRVCSPLLWKNSGPTVGIKLIMGNGTKGPIMGHFTYHKKRISIAEGGGANHDRELIIPSIYLIEYIPKKKGEESLIIG